MSESIRFDNFLISETGFTCTVKSSLRENPDEQLFEMSAPDGEKLSIPSVDAIAYTLSTLCGRTYKEVYLDLEITEECRKNLQSFTQADIICPEKAQSINQSPSLFRKILSRLRCTNPNVKSNDNNTVILNFSGGFDSLAAWCLMPKHTKLVAVDFGGWFERETEFFEKFSPYILKTNFRKLKYDRESWTFMGTGSLLFAENLGARYNVFGTILEASPNQVKDDPVNARQQETMPFSGLGLKDMRIVNGLTEVGTAIICTYYCPELITDSLKSLAAPKSEKRFRKQVLTEIVCKKMQRNIELPPCEAPDAKQVLLFGKNFALDFLALYELKYASKEIVEKTVSNIPLEAFELAEELSLEFYEKMNPKFLNSIPEEMRDEYLLRLKEAGVDIYSEKDWEEFRKVRTFLGKYHPGVL